MHILITGAAGMLGRKLTARLVNEGALNGRPLERLTLLDVDAPEPPQSFPGHVTVLAADIAGPSGLAGSKIGRMSFFISLPSFLVRPSSSSRRA
jgi:nucleoside-diphosphate-sugar epimerase